MNPRFSNSELFKVWGYVAAHSFGGPAGQIAVIYKLVVEEKKLISEERFLHALNFCMLLPGPEAQQLATYMGWMMAKWRGGLIAGGLFILPGFLSILGLSYLYVLYKDLSLVQGLFYGIKPAIIAIVLAALHRISKKSLKTTFRWILALSAFVALFFFNLPFPLVVLSAGTLGVFQGIISRQLGKTQELEGLAEECSKPPVSETLKTLCLWLSVWLFPIIMTLLTLGKKSTFHTVNLFFSKMSMVTFGGAYAALSYVAQQAVEVYEWLQGNEMLDGLALAETTPGPLIQVVQFVGFMGSYRFPGELHPLFSAFIGSVLTTWMTFAPCFLFIFTFAPHIEYIRGKKVFSDALSAITASIVGVILNLSLWFVLNSLVQNSRVDYYAVGICLVSLSLQFIFKKGLFTILGTATLLGVIIKTFA